MQHFGPKTKFLATPTAGFKFRELNSNCRFLSQIKRFQKLRWSTAPVGGDSLPKAQVSIEAILCLVTLPSPPAKAQHTCLGNMYQLIRIPSDWLQPYMLSNCTQDMILI